VVFDDVPAALTDDAVRALYGMEAADVVGETAPGGFAGALAGARA
jgi:hypothetical protein